MKKYALAEVFKTLQGEGINAGRSAVFVRFAGCNLWTGREATRASDAARTGAQCPMFCDTDFKARFSVDCNELVTSIAHHLPADLVVFTGGEPMLQLTHWMLGLLREVCPGVELAVETNGATEPQEGVLGLLDHVCVSPKLPDQRTVLRAGDELKVVFPRYKPEAYTELAKGFKHLLVSPEASVKGVGVSEVQQLVERLAAEWVMAHPPWRLSLQLHKHLGVP